jgi:hypothetical protein
MASTPQSKFNVTLPTQDTAVPPNALVAGELTQVDFEVTAGGSKSTYAAQIDPAALPGAVLEVPFSATTPPFVPVAGTTYTADAFVVDANGASTPSTSTTWTQVAAAAPPAAPTGFSVA